MISQGDEGKGRSWCDGQSAPGECTSVHPAEAHTHSFCGYFEALVVSVLSMTIELLFLQRRKPSTRVVELIIRNGG